MQYFFVKMGKMNSLCKMSALCKSNMYIWRSKNKKKILRKWSADVIFNFFA